MTANITYRLGVGTPPASTTTKGAPLNNTEIDGNFKSILNDIDLKATIISPTFSGTPAAPTATAGTSTTQIATTQFVLNNSVLKGAAAAAGTFDTSATDPIGTTRLNYGGYFYPTQLNLNGTADTTTAATHYFVETATDGTVRPKPLANVKTEIVTTAAVNSAAATTVGTVTSGAWQGTAVAIGYGGTGAATQQLAINALTGATTAGSYLRGNGTNVVMSAIQAADVPTLNQDTSGTATNAVNLNGTGTALVSALPSSGYGLWNSAPITYGMLMATGVDATYGGRMPAVSASAVQVAAADSNSDYNMYFTMSSGTNRGFIFRTAVGTKLFGINPDGVRSAVAMAAPSFNGITVASDAAATALAAAASAGVSTKVSREDHVHPYPTPANLGTYTKTEIDQLVTGLDVKASVRVATIANTALSGLLTIDGVVLVAADRVLVKNQTNPIENGIWVAAAGAWTRATDADGTGELTPGSYVLVTSGTQANTGWIENTIGTVTPGTTPMTWVQFNGLGQIDAGAGMTKTGNVLNVQTANTANIVVNADNIDLATVTQGGTGTFKKITLDTYGRVTGNAAVAFADVSALSTGTANSTTFQRGDGIWSVPTGTTYVGSTAIALNRATATQNLTGIAGIKTDDSSVASTDMTITTGTGNAASAISGNLFINTGSTVAGGSFAGGITIQSGSSGGAQAGNISLTGGTSSGSGAGGGSIYLTGGGSASTTPGQSNGNIYIAGGVQTAASGNKYGGQVYIDGGRPAAGGSIASDGQVYIGTKNTVGAAGTTVIGIGNALSTTTITGPVNLPTIGTSGFVKLGASGQLSADTTLYVSVGASGSAITTYAAGDILYASAANTLSKLPKGTDGQVLKLASGLPAWGTDNDTIYTHPNTVTAGTVSEGGTARTLAFSGTFNVPSITYNANGHITSTTTTAITLPANPDTNYYPTGFAWTGGTTAGPTGSLTGTGMSAVPYAAIPAAGTGASGIVTTGSQAFDGIKTFNDTTDSTSGYTSGAVLIAGGLGVAKKIQTGGNIGVGTIPSAWEVSGRSVVEISWGAITATGSGTVLTTNTYFNGTNWIARTTSAAAYYSCNMNGTHSWYTAASVGVGATQSFVQKMNLTAAGDLTATSFNSITGLGTTVTALGTSTAGSAATVSKSDHVHQMPTASQVGAVAPTDTFYIGTTAIAHNRASAAISLTGITSIDGTAGTANALNTGNSYTGVNFTSTGRFLAANGSATAPSIGWSSDGATDTGFYWGGDGYTYFTNNGVKSGEIQAGGHLLMVGNVTAYSDERLKSNWKDFAPDFLAKLAKVKVGTYDRTDIKTTQVGISAQSLQPVMPEAVVEQEDGMLSVAYGNAALAACIMLARKVEELEARLAALEA